MSPGLFALLVVLAIDAPGRASTQPAASNPTERRVVKMFDFDESRLGNFEETPMFWAMHTGKGYPRYLEAHFDRAVGHEAPPCMKLPLLGGHIGAVYGGRDIPIDPRSTYQVEAWVRPDRLVHARAFVAAFYLDADFHKIDSTQLRSDPVGEGLANADWQRVVIDLPPAPPAARWIGISCWVLQPQADARSDAPFVPIRKQDFQGGAWFDDVAVLRLPRVNLRFRDNPGIFAAGEPILLDYQVQDPDGVGMTPALIVRDAAGQVVRERAVPVDVQPAAPTTTDLSDLPPGWYAARLTVHADDRDLLYREVAFVRLAPDLPTAQTGASGVGTVLDGWTGASWPQVRRLVQHLSVSAIKVPLWSSRVAGDDLMNGDSDLDQFLRDLHNDRIAVTAVLAEPPTALADQFERARRTLLDVLMSSPDRWRPWLAVPVARSGANIGAWQVGRDCDLDLLADPRWPEAVERVLSEIAALSSVPAMVAPRHGLFWPDDRRADMQYLSVAMPSSIPPDGLDAQLATFLKKGYAGVWVMLESLPADLYEREVRLADLARRLVRSRVAGAHVAFVEQPWLPEDRRPGDALHTRDEALPPLTPSEDYLIVRTMGQALAGCAPPTPLNLGEYITAWLFPREDGPATLVAWRQSADGGPVNVRLDCGPEARQFDMFGRIVSTLSEAGCNGLAGFAVDYAPTIIAPADADLVRLQQSFALKYPSMPPLLKELDNAVLLRNAFDHTLRATVTLVPPREWTIEPARLDVTLDAGAAGEYPVRFRLPANAAAGEEAILMRVDLDTAEGRTFELSLPLELALDDVLMDVLMQCNDGRLILRQTIRNNSQETIDVQGFMVAPDRPRISHLIRKLAPGSQASRSFEVTDPQSLFGQSLRIGIEQIGGPRRLNRVVRIEP